MITQQIPTGSSYLFIHYKTAAALLAAMAASCAFAQPAWTPAEGSSDVSLATNWSPNITITSGTTTNTNGVIFNPVGTGTTALTMSADLQFAGGTSPSSNAILFNGAGFTIGGTGTRQLTIGGQGIAINTTNTITLDVPRIRRNASNTFEFLGANGNLVINGEYSTNITGATNVSNNIAFSGEANAENNNNTLTFNGNIVNVFTGTTPGAGLGNMSISRAGAGTGNRVIFNNSSNTGLTGTVSIGAGTEAHLGDGGTKGTLAGATITNSGRFVVNQSDAVQQGVEFADVAISGGGIFEQRGAGITTLTASNTFSGGVIISGGKLSINASERINNVNKLTLNGGNFDVSTFTETLGVLSVGASNGTLTLGEGGKFIFADSSAEAWAGSLTIAGSFISGSSVKFGGNASSLSAGQLSSISIAGFTGVGLDGSGFLTATAVPEPSAFAALAGLGALGFVASRRRRQA
jgi:autotransporter-associated beta strand protein